MSAKKSWDVQRKASPAAARPALAGEQGPQVVAVVEPRPEGSALPGPREPRRALPHFRLRLR